MDRGHECHQSVGIDPEWSLDSFYGGQLHLYQPRNGYRVNIDTLLLADLVRQSRRERITRLVDLGAGVGALALCIRQLTPVESIELLERDAGLVSLADRNLIETGAAGSALRIDLATDGIPPALAGSADVVVCNPPFFEPAAVRQRTNPAERPTRSGPLQPFLRAAAACLGRRGAAFIVYPAATLAELLADARRFQLHPKQLRFVHPYADRPARIALLELRHARPGGLFVHPPLVEWTAPGVRSDAVIACLAGPAGGRPAGRLNPFREDDRR